MDHTRCALGCIGCDEKYPKKREKGLFSLRENFFYFNFFIIYWYMKLKKIGFENSAGNQEKGIKFTHPN